MRAADIFKVDINAIGALFAQFGLEIAVLLVVESAINPHFIEQPIHLGL